MVLMMSRPTRRSSSRNHQFQKRLPADVVDRLLGVMATFRLPGTGPLDPEIVATVKLRDPFRFSLQTTDDRLAKRRQAAAEEQFAALVHMYRSGPAALTHQETVALAGVWYAELVADWSADPGRAEAWDEMREQVRDAALDAIRHGAECWDTLDKTIGAAGFLAARGLVLDPASRHRFLEQAARALDLGAARLARMAEGDYSPDPAAARFPQWDRTAQPVPPSESGRVVKTFDDLFARWRQTGDKAPSTVANWKALLAQFSAFLGHDDPALVTQADVIRWKDKLVADGRKRIDDTALACLRALYAPAVAERAVTGVISNPALGVASRQTKSKTGKLPYSDAEVAKLLAAAAEEENAARRWLVPLLAFTGARVGELCQLWAENVEKIDGISVVHIRPAPDGGTSKTEGSERTIPLHPELVRLGFLDFVRKRGSGPLFYAGTTRRAVRARPDGERRHASKGTANRLAEWIRDLGFNDPRKSPNHAFRHWMKTAMLKASVATQVADKIQGHSSNSTADVYRHVDLDMMAKALERIPVPKPADAQPSQNVSS